MTQAAAVAAQPDELPLPQDFAAEQAVLGSLLLEPEAAAHAFAIVTPFDFYRTYHQVIAAACFAIYERREPVDLVTVGAYLRKEGKLDEVGGGEYLSALIGEVPTASHVRRYANIVAEKAILRQMIRDASEVSRQARLQPEDLGAFLAGAGAKFTELYRSRVGASVFQSLEAEFEDDAQRLWTDMYRKTGPVSSARLGIGRVDELTGGLETYRYVVIKADTKHGKSQLLRQAMLTTARRFRDDGSGRLVVGFVLEEGVDTWKRKCWSWMAGIDSRILIKPGRGEYHFAHHPEDSERLTDAQCEWLTLAPRLKVAFHARDIRQIEAQCRALSYEHPIGMICIDYFQLITGGEGQTEEQQFSRNSQRLQALADDLKCPVVVPSQVTQDSRTGKINTKGARAIEHNTGMTLLWQRDEEGGEFQDRGVLSCLLDRDGPGFGPQRLITRKNCGRFWDEREYALEHSQAGGYQG